jgi:hypothetical protein
MLAEWLHKGKPTALGLASGIVAGLVAVTPASGYIYMWGGLAIGLIAGVVCYISVCLKPVFKYDDSLDAFGVHGVGGFLGAVLTGIFCYKAVNDAAFPSETGIIGGNGSQMLLQVKAAAISAVLAFVGSLILTKLVDVVFSFITDPRSEIEGLDRTEHGEVGFDFGPSLELAPEGFGPEPRAATVPPNGMKHFTIVIDGPNSADLIKVWSDLCQVGTAPATAEFKAVYPYMTTVQGNRFRFRGGDPESIRTNLIKLFQGRVTGTVRVHVEQ